MTTQQIDEAPTTAGTGSGDPERKIHILCRPCKRRDQQHARQPAARCGYVKPTKWSDSLEDADGQPREFCSRCESIADNEEPCGRCGASVRAA